MNKYKQTNTGYIEEIITGERYKKHGRRLFITAFHEKKHSASDRLNRYQEHMGI